MRLCETFESIQGEGRFAGYPALFIRVSGCNLNCPWCDTKYHKDGTPISLSALINLVRESPRETIIWTGGEPTLYIRDIMPVIRATPGKTHMIETNGTRLTESLREFAYVSISPKRIEDAERANKFFSFVEEGHYDIKVVTDLKKVGMELLPYATMLMPLTTFNYKRDKAIKQRVWQFCANTGLKYAARIHIDVWGKKRSV